MKRLVMMAIGWAFGFAFAIAVIAAIGLAAIGIGGHLLWLHEKGLAEVLGFDPSEVATRAPVPGAAALVLLGVFVAIARRLDRAHRVDARE